MVTKFSSKPVSRAGLPEVDLPALSRREARPNAAGVMGRVPNQALLGHLGQRPAHRHTGYGKLLHEGQLTWQTSLKAALLQLLTQQQIDLVVLGQGQALVHGCNCGISPIDLSIGHLPKKAKNLQKISPSKSNR